MWVKVLIFSCFLIGVAISDNTSNCDIEAIDDDGWKWSYKIDFYDNQVNEHILESSYKGTLENLACTSNCLTNTGEDVDCTGKFIATTTNDSYFIMYTADDMKTFDEYMLNINGNGKITYICSMTCEVADKTSKLTFEVTVKDYNSHAPDFAEGERTYKVASPIMPLTDFSFYGVQISATDKDFTNKDITFTITPEDFDVTKTEDTSTTPSTFVANFRSKKFIQIVDPVKYTITATDSGTDPKPLSSSIEVTLDLDPDKTLEIPTFIYPDTSLSYTFQYEDNNTLTVLKGPISVKTNKPSLVKNVLLSGDFANQFSAVYDPTTSEVTLKVESNIDNPTVSYIILTLSLETDMAASTPVIIYFSNVPTDAAPKFTQHLYTGTYDDSTNTVSLNQNIQVITTSTEEPNVTVSGDFAEHFKVSLDTDKKTYKVTVEKPLTVDEIKSKDYLTLTLQATVDKASDTSALIISLPNHNLEFTQILYTAAYNKNHTVTIDETQPIAFAVEVSGVNITVENKYSEYFAVTSKDNKYSLAVNKHLPDKILNSQTEITVTITAKDQYNDESKAVIQITLPDKDSTESPKFSDPYYVVQYKKNQSGYIDFNPAVSFDNAKITEVKISLNQYSDNFELVLDSNKWRIKIKKALDATIFDASAEIVITMEASITGVTEKGVGVLIIELVDGSTSDKSPKFKEPYYIVQYKKDQIDYLDFNTAVSFDNAENSEVKIAINQYSDNFELVLDSNKWRIKIKKALDAAIFDAYAEIVITMEAAITGVTEKGVGVLIIELVDGSTSDKSPKFKEPYYIVQYKKDQIDYLDFNTAVAFDNAENSEVKISINQYSDNFELILDSNKWRIKIKKALDAAIFDASAEIVITMEAAITGVTEKGIGVLIIELVNDTNTDKAPQFSEQYYTVQYQQGQTGYIEFDKSVSFTNVEHDKVKIKLDAYFDNFEITYESNRWRLKINKVLDDTILENNTDLITIMEATEDNVEGKGTAVLIIQLVVSKVPKFKKAYYEAEYPESGTGTILFQDDLSFENIKDLNKVTITVSEYNNFEIKYDSGKKKWQINILNPLDDSTLETNSYIVATLQANIMDNNYSPETAFVLTLPEKKAEEGPAFSKSYYKANYTIKGTTAVVTFEDDIEFTNKNDMSKIKIISDEFSSHFSFEYNKKWQLISDILDADLLTRTDLVVSMTATDTTNKLEGYSVIDLKLPSVNTDDAPKFKKTYYTGSYEISGDKSTVTLDENFEFSNKADVTGIKITTDKYSENFEFSYTNKAWTVTVSKNLDQSVLNAQVDIVMAIIATENSNTDEIGQSALLLTLPKINNEEAPKFSNISYESSCNKKTTILASEITIVNRKDVSKINVSLNENEFKSNFAIDFNITTNSWFVRVISIPDTITKSKTDLVLTLNAIETDNKNIGQAALIINFPVLSSPQFSKDQYYGSYIYNDSSPFKIDDFSIINKEEQSNIVVDFSSTDGDFSDNFNVTYDSKNNIWKMTLIKLLDDAKIKDKTELVLTLTATEEENDNLGKATVIIYLTNNNDIDFTEVHYTGLYESDAGKGSVILFKNIQITSTKDISTAVVTITSDDDFDASNYFNLDPISDHYNVTVKNPLPQEIIQKQKSLVMTLEVSLGSSKSYATLVVNLPVQASDNTIKFESPLYNGEYNVAIDGKIDFTADTAVIVSDEDAANIVVTISGDSTYGKYFTLSIADKKVKLVKVVDLPEETYTKESVIPITLVATISGKVVTASTVVNIKINYDNYQGSVQFESSLYNGKYEIKNKVVSVTVDTIKLTTDKVDNIVVSVSNSFKDYFTATFSKDDSIVTIAKVKDIPDSVLQDISTISILLTASIKNTQITTSTVVNLRIINDDSPTPDVTGIILFNTVSNTAEYAVENGKGNLNLDQNIGVTTDRKNDEIETNITDGSGLSTYFKSSYSNQLFLVELVEDLPEDTFLSKTFVSLTLTASIKGTSLESKAVLIIRFDNDQSADTGRISFSSAVFNGVYEINENVASISDIDKIVVDTDQGDANISVSVLNDMDKYFTATYFNKAITVSLATTAANKILRSQHNIAVVLFAQIKNTLHIAETVVNFRVKDNDSGDNTDNSTIVFPKFVYQGEYVLEKDHSVKFNVDDITLETERTENEIGITIDNEFGYEKYFTVSLEHGHVSLNLKEKIPESTFEEQTVIPIILTATVKKSSYIQCQAVLNIKLTDQTKVMNEQSPTKYIVAISILSIFIILLIIAAILFYYLRLRNSKYNKMTEEEYMNHNNKVKFDRSAARHSGTGNMGAPQFKGTKSQKAAIETSKEMGGASYMPKRSSAIENRRPTGFIFNRNVTDVNEPRESSTDAPEMHKERRKSVAFDENVEKLQIDQINDDDIDKVLDENTKETENTD